MSKNLQKNGIIERKNRKFVEMTRNMLREKILSNNFLVEVVTIVIYLLNISSTKMFMNMIQYEAWFCRKPKKVIYKLLDTLHMF